jgi:hypothetical protein
LSRYPCYFPSRRRMVELLKKIIHKSLGKLGSVQIVSAKHGFILNSSKSFPRNGGNKNLFIFQISIHYY